MRNALYHNNRDEAFDDMAISNGIGKVTRLMSGWGVKYFDYDNDGNLDLFLANGHPDDKIEEHSTDVKYCEPMLLFRGDGKKFENISAASGPVFAKPYASRGMALGDFNNDGALDVLGSAGLAFGTSDNAAIILGADGTVTEVPRGPKEVLADVVWDMVLDRLPALP